MSATPYTFAQDAYAELGIDTEFILKNLGEIPISLQCWQGDDVLGFENSGEGLSGGIQATGNYPGRAQTIKELRQDLDQVFSLLPGNHRLNLHAIYGDFAGQKIDRNAISITHFQSWIEWCRERNLGLDFNPSYFSHPLAASGATLSHHDPNIREFWIQHGILARCIGDEMGRQLSSPCVTNIWIPDGSKDLPADRKGPRERLESSLDAIFAQPLATNLDAVESKLFGIGSEAYVVGSHEFYLGYCVSRQKILCLDAGHFHPTETLADKISSTLQFVPEILLHVINSASPNHFLRRLPDCVHYLFNYFERSRQSWFTPRNPSARRHCDAPLLQTFHWWGKLPSIQFILAALLSVKSISPSVFYEFNYSQ